MKSQRLLTVGRKGSYFRLWARDGDQSKNLKKDWLATILTVFMFLSDLCKQGNYSFALLSLGVYLLLWRCFIFFFKIAVILFSYFFVLYSLLWFLLPTMSRSGQPQDLNTLVFLSFFHLNLLKKINFILCYTRCVLICNCLIFVCCKHLYYKC